MKIDPGVGGITDGQAPTRVGAPNSAPVSRPSQSQAGNTDQASLSSDAVKFSSLSNALSSVPEIRQERVAAISQQLQNGSYSVSDHQIAQAVLRDYQPNSAAGG
jgi:flagellar biosynthesis anti-sigma factor FlgM